jgi:hypothetical protein
MNVTVHRRHNAIHQPFTQSYMECQFPAAAIFAALTRNSW